MGEVLLVYHKCDIGTACRKWSSLAAEVMKLSLTVDNGNQTFHTGINFSNHKPFPTTYSIVIVLALLNIDVLTLIYLFHLRFSTKSTSCAQLESTIMPSLFLRWEFIVQNLDNWCKQLICSFWNATVRLPLQAQATFLEASTTANKPFLFCGGPSPRLF